MVEGDDRSPRLPTGVPGLDRVLCGGLLKGGLYLISGPSGTGKTVLATHLCFARAAAGDRVAYVTLWAESHGLLLSHAAGFEFFDEEATRDRLLLVSGAQACGGELRALHDLVRNIVQSHSARLLVIDSLAPLIATHGPGEEVVALLRDLATSMALSGCTTVLVCPTNSAGPRPEEMAADGVLRLERQLIGMRAARVLDVSKFRGSPHLDGKHFFEIASRGFVVHPRLESVVSERPPAREVASERVRFGVVELDRMLSGGLAPAAATLLLGRPGSGKTILGLHFLAEGIRQGEPSVYFGFNETPPRLLTKAHKVGLDFSEAIADRTVEFLWHPPLEFLLDPLAARLLDAVARVGARRVFIDGFDGLRQITLIQSRLPMFMTALTTELRARGISLVVSMETSLFGEENLQRSIDLSGGFENLLLLRWAEVGSQLYRLLSILKVRESDYDPSSREFRISSQGIDVAESFASAEMILRGTIRPGATKDVAERPKTRARKRPRRGT
jgi:circadian clock protein KaiC